MAADAAIREVMARMATDFAAAERAAQELLDRNPSDPQVLQLRAFIHNFRKDHEAAFALLDRAAALAPDDARIAFNRAYMRQQGGRHEEAARLFAIAAALPGADRDTPLLAAMNAAWAGGVFTPVTRTHPLSPAAGLAQALLLARLGAGQASVMVPPAHAGGLVAFLNRHDVSGFGMLDDKQSLWRLASEISPGLIPRTFCDEAEREALLAAHAAAPGLWIGKHARLFGGQGLILSRDPAALPLGGGRIVQRMVERPLLVDGRRFHLRAYLLVESAQTFRAHAHRAAIVRVAPLALASEGDLEDGRHITNTLRYRDDPALAARARVTDLAAIGEIHAGIGEAVAQAARLAALVVRDSGAALKAIAGDPAAVPPKLLGLDLVVDRDMRAWLLEIERYPALKGGSPAADAVNAAVWRDCAALLCESRCDPASWTSIGQ